MRRILVLFALVSSVADLGAQERHRRSGLWGGFGIATASYQTMCDSCPTTGIAGPGAVLRIGGSPTPNLLLGGEIAAWSQSALGVEQTATYLALIARWYPWTARGFHLKFGIGGGGYVREDGTNTDMISGGGGTFGIGYDVPLARSISVTPFLEGFSVQASNTKRNGTQIVTATGTMLTLGMLGVAVTIH